MSRDLRPISQIRVDALRRVFLWDVLSSRMEIYLVSEYPKSGGSWVAQMLSHYLGLPFPRNQRAAFRSSVLHGHRLFHRRFGKALWVIRDGRDVMVSLYFHVLFDNDRNSPHQVEAARRLYGFADVEDISANMPRFIEVQLTRGDGWLFRFTWQQFVRSWFNSGIPPLRYEDLLADPKGSLGAAIARITGQAVDDEMLRATIDRFEFTRLAGRPPGREARGSFLRKGVAGDWQNYFSHESRKVFHALAGPALIAAGYERSSDWVSESDVG